MGDIRQQLPAFVEGLAPGNPSAWEQAVAARPTLEQGPLPTTILIAAAALSLGGPDVLSGDSFLDRTEQYDTDGSLRILRFEASEPDDGEARAALLNATGLRLIGAAIIFRALDDHARPDPQSADVAHHIMVTDEDGSVWGVRGASLTAAFEAGPKGSARTIFASFETTPGLDYEVETEIVALNSMHGDRTLVGYRPDGSGQTRELRQIHTITDQLLQHIGTQGVAGLLLDQINTNTTG